MQKLIETLKSLGIDIPDDKQQEVKTALSKSYKNIAEHEKAISKLESDRDAWKSKAETAEETISGLEAQVKELSGVDTEKLNKEIDDWKERAEKAEKDAQAQILKRDQADYLKAEFDKLGITSERTRKSLMAEIMGEDGLKWKDGAFMGLADYLKAENEKDHFYQTEEEKAAADQQAEAEAARVKAIPPITKPQDKAPVQTKPETPEVPEIF